ncbi:hypothetical protein [Bifidobacterium panos]|uniref:Uncharacterized protein n=1 Tax=Bifidobacterium panos TaxID=2675321 RepID=A0ABX1SYB7_9BIFI|nr:hypothetical protein [Bifidobacterium sp. DSM 109963]NMN02841.1 hypothetical protein [Bifidobacterium sp. DSM 109963]
MSWETHTFHRPVCDYPDCGECYSGGYYGWKYDKGMARDEVADDPSWLVLDDDAYQPRFFCTRHLRLDGNRWPVLFDFDDDKCLPRNAELIPYYLDSWMQPLPKPECEDTIREILKGDGK